METKYLDPFIETLGREALRQIQLKKLQITLGPVLKTNEFYRQKMEKAGVKQPEDVQTIEDYQRLPFTTKEELSSDQMANPPYGTNLTFPRGQYTRTVLKRLLGQDDRLKVIHNPSRIVSTGLNAALSAARGKIIIRMDAHTEYAKDYIRQCVAVLKETGADNVGGPCMAVGRQFVSQAIAAAFYSSFVARGASGHDPSYEGMVDTAYLGCWPREVFDGIGLFDEELSRNQDDEFHLRLTRAGGKIWQSPRIRCWYHARGSLSAILRQYLQYGYWKVRVIQKHNIPASVRHLVPACFVLSVIVLPLASFW